MYWLERYLKQDHEFPSTTGIETIELPEKGFLSGIELRCEGIAGPTITKPDVFFHDALTKIELITGGKEPLKSLTGEQLLAHMMYQKIPVFSHDVKLLPTGSVTGHFYINMGMKYHDTDYMLDLSRLTDPKLQLTYDFTQTSHHGWANGEAYATSPKPKYNLLCHMPEDFAGAPRGFIKTTEADRFTSAALKKENLNVPRGPVYSNLYVQSWYKGEGLSTNLDELEINFGAGKMIPYRVALDDLLAQIVRKYGLFRLVTQCYLTDTQNFPAPFECGEVLQNRCTVLDRGLLGGDVWGAGWHTYIQVFTTGALSGGSTQFWVTWVGALPFGVAAIPFVDPDDERTWIKSGDWGNLWVKIDETAGAGTNAVIKLLTDEVVTAY